MSEPNETRTSYAVALAESHLGLFEGLERELMSLAAEAARHVQHDFDGEVGYGASQAKDNAMDLLFSLLRAGDRLSVKLDEQVRPALAALIAREAAEHDIPTH